MIAGAQWSRLYALRQEIRKTYPTIWDVPLVKKELDRLLPNIREGCRILEVGAGDRRFERKLKGRLHWVTYRSCDVDTETMQDYYSVEEITEEFDFIFMFELIEHLSPEEGLALLRRLWEILRPGGCLLLGTPNLYHPHRYFGDITHKTPYKYEELGAVMLMAGFTNLRAYRMYNDAALRRWLRIRLGVVLHRYLDVDFAPTLLMEGEKPPAGPSCTESDGRS
ncbi:MAG: class I SAM-dependent methyltransferase [Deltaproteobacteria bacterium]|nr:class I SAM-dependent methyltransferase [Deltaproteobacteria bacterium]